LILSIFMLFRSRCYLFLMLFRSRPLQSYEPLQKNETNKYNGAIKDSLAKDTPWKGFVQTTLEKSKNDIFNIRWAHVYFGYFLLDTMAKLWTYLVANEIGFGDFRAIRDNVILNKVGNAALRKLWLLWYFS